MIANLLGVAGTDVPIEEIQKLMIPHMVSNVICIFFTFYFTKTTNYFLSLVINYESNNYTTIDEY